MRASCGHHGGALVVFHAELPTALVVSSIVNAPLVVVPAGSIHVVDGPAPSEPPPEPSVV